MTLEYFWYLYDYSGPLHDPADLTVSKFQITIAVSHQIHPIETMFRDPERCIEACDFSDLTTVSSISHQGSRLPIMNLPPFLLIFPVALTFSILVPDDNDLCILSISFASLDAGSDALR